MKKRINNVIQSFPITEKAFFYAFAGILILTALIMLFRVNQSFLVEIPQFGGELTEGVIGSPRFINPVLALSDTDRDMSVLVYSGLMRVDTDGNLIEDLALSHTISEDGLRYDFKIRSDAVFHDGEEVTADDVIYTINMIKDPVVRSPLRGNWEGITVEKINDYEISFYLPEVYSPFLYNTTLGILPEHIWGNTTSEEFAFNFSNTDPIGSGPYVVKDVERDSSGIIRRYRLKAFEDFTLGRPYIKEINIKVFKNSEELGQAILSGNVSSGHTLHPEEAKEIKDEGIQVLSIPLPRIFGVFFNQNNAPALAQKSLRQALDVAIDREKIVEEVLKGYGNPEYSVIPESILSIEEDREAEEALEILTRAGWTTTEDGTLILEGEEGDVLASFSLATSNVPELVTVGNMIVQDWKEIGVDVRLEVFETNDISQNIIRAREFDALLFGEVIGRDLDLFAFWHSSQRNDPGLNISGYTNLTVDQLLEQARTVLDSSEREGIYTSLVEEIGGDIPASFVYSPNFIYVLDEDVKAKLPSTVTVPAERFAEVHKWYIDTETVWQIFAK